ncbi:hypothetical protein [Agreia sp. COWG]|uniref:hypothetical protein n=1 Tax=Agreia sp. COWG TaxID=2773266 RepID=UPI001926B38E|nr:hypothetical protein [Agreia sp. COWG]CAD6010138.1 protein of unknown function [Agreia sp. COWG]
MDLSAPRTLLEAVLHLHQLGYESVRVHAYRYATGHWRCELSRLGTPIKGGDRIFGYSSASDWDFLGDGNDQPIAPDALARLLIERVPALAGLRTSAKAYTVWYSVLLDHCAPGGLFILSDDCGYDARRDGYVQLGRPIGSPAGAMAGDQFPLSPVF